MNIFLGRQNRYKSRRAAVKPPMILSSVFLLPDIAYLETVAVPEAVFALILASYIASHLIGGRLNCPA